MILLVTNSQERRTTAHLERNVRERGNIQCKDTTKVLDKSINFHHHWTFSWQMSLSAQSRCQTAAVCSGWASPVVLVSFPEGKLWVHGAPLSCHPWHLCRSKAKVFRHHFGIVTASLINRLLSASPRLNKSCLSLWICGKGLLPAGGENPHSTYWGRKDPLPGTSITFIFLRSTYYFVRWLEKGITCTAGRGLGFRCAFRSRPLTVLLSKAYLSRAFSCSNCVQRRAIIAMFTLQRLTTFIWIRPASFKAVFKLRSLWKCVEIQAALFTWFPIFHFIAYHYIGNNGNGHFFLGVSQWEVDVGSQLNKMSCSLLFWTFRKGCSSFGNSAEQHPHFQSFRYIKNKKKLSDHLIETLPQKLPPTPH